MEAKTQIKLSIIPSIIFALNKLSCHFDSITMCSFLSPFHPLIYNLNLINRVSSLHA